MIRTWIRNISILLGLLLLFIIILFQNIPEIQNCINRSQSDLVSVNSSSNEEVSVVLQNIESWVNTIDSEYDEFDTFNGIEEMENDESSLVDSLNYELNIWMKLIENKLNYSIPNLQNDINKEVSKLIHLKNDTIWLPLLKNWEIKQIAEESSIKKHINDIICNGEWDSNNEVMIYYNKKTGKRIPQYVTRPLINSMISNSLENLTKLYSRLNSELNETFLKDYETMIEQLINLHVSIFEEWGESVFTEWSQRMANNDFLWDENDIPISIWKKYLNIKKSTIDKYNDLQGFKPVSDEWFKFLNDCQTQLNVTFDKYNQNLNKLMDLAIKEFELRDSFEKP